MKRLLALALLTAALPAAAQRPGCEYYRAASALGRAEAAIAQGVAARGLEQARSAAMRTGQALQEAGGVLQGCGCRLLAEDAEDAATLAWRAVHEADATAMRSVLERARFALQTLREREGRTGCS